MSIKRKEKLFELIHSLTKNEKRYFKRFSGMHTIGEQNEYVKLFDAVEKQPVYDEPALKKKFKGESFISRLDVRKVYLYNLVLKSLEVYHSSIDSELRSLLNQLEVLLEKGLWEHCKLLILKIEQKALRHERYNYALEALLYKYRLPFKQPVDTATENEIITDLTHGNSYAQKTENMFVYNNITAQVVLLSNKSGGEIRNRKQWDNIIKDPLLQKESKAITLNSKLHRYDILFRYYSVNNNLKVSHQYLVKAIKLFESNTYLVYSSTNLYVHFLRNLINVCSELKRYSDARHFLYLLKNVSTDNKINLSTRIESQIFDSAYVGELNLFIKTGEFEKVDSIMQDVEYGLAKYKYSGRISRKRQIILIYNIAYLAMINGDYKKSLYWLTKILSDNANMQIEDELIYFSSLLRLILYYELRYTQELPYVIISTHRFLVKREKMYAPTKSIMTFLRKTRKISGQRHLKSAFTELKEKIELIQKDPAEKKHLEYFDIVSWLESKIENRPLAEIMREKIKRGNS